MATHYTPPRYIDRALYIASNEHDNEIVTTELRRMTKRHNALLQELYRTNDNYSRMLQVYGPHHQVELGEPLSRFESILRKALNDSQ